MSNQGKRDAKLMYFLLFEFRWGCITKGFTDSVDHIDIKGVNYVFTYLYWPMEILQPALKLNENCFVIYLCNSNYSSM